MERNIKLRWWFLMFFGFVLLYSTANVIFATIIFLCALAVLYYVQVRKIDLLLAKIQEDIRKLKKNLQKMLPKN